MPSQSSSRTSKKATADSVAMKGASDTAKTALPVAKLSQNLVAWYTSNHRPLPWRQDRNPYRIWISEVMLQQTTVQAVVPYYERFMRTFPDVHSLATAAEAEVLQLWAGLGYYSRARNLHKAAKTIHAQPQGFPKTSTELLELPGFGPYTSAAVASIAFGEAVGVLDGNVIRILSRLTAQPLRWWETGPRKVLQDLATDLAQHSEPHLLNQAMMELGATVCTPKSPNCAICPWMKNCEAYKQDVVQSLPLAKPRKESEIWYWEAQIHIQGDKVGLLPNDYLPFLKGQLVFPGSTEKRKTKPKDFSFKHGITHHEIFVDVVAAPKISKKNSNPDLKWIRIADLAKHNPSSLLQKALHHWQQGQH